MLTVYCVDELSFLVFEVFAEECLDERVFG